MKEKIISQEITQELKQAYLDYAMSVIVSRALPDARDGLKPVQRRILYVMKELGLWAREKFTKCANIVGTCLARYHPHGDQPVYEALVRMGQDFTLRYPLIKGQGNFGSVDGDPPAQMRYTEAKLEKIAEEMLADIDKETVDFRPNYDNTRKEPVVLPAKIPNLIINGSLGIAVGMATSIAPHNLFEVMSAVKLLVKKPEAEIDEILKIIKGPDFPTGGIIYTGKKLKQIYEEGKGGLVVRGEVLIEKGRKERLVITSIPWQVNKAELVKEIALLALEKVLPEIKDVRDESNKEGIRIVIETKGGDLEKLKENLYRLTSLQKTFYFNFIALDKGIQPKLFSLKELLFAWIDHRREVIRRRTKFDLERNKERVHLLEGFDKALENLDRVINTIKTSKDKKEALEKLMKKFNLSETQADAILEMPLRTLTQMERHKILEELKERKSIIKELELILKNPKKIDEIIIQEADEIIKNYPTERLTKVVEEEPEISLTPEVLEEKVWLVLDQKNLVSLTSLEKFNLEKVLKDPGPKILKIVSTKDKLLVLTKKGKLYAVDLVNFYHQAKYLESQIILDKDDEIVKILVGEKFSYLLLLTQNGLGKKLNLEEVLTQRRTGTQVIKLTHDFLVEALPLQGGEIIGVLSDSGNILLFKENLPLQGKLAKGVKILRGGKILKGFVKKSDLLLLIFKKGFYKKVDLKEIKIQNRGTKGVKLFENKYGDLLFADTLTEEKELILKDDKLKRMDLQKLPFTKRTQAAKKFENLDFLNSVILI